jgi:hypothetical protein
MTVIEEQDRNLDAKDQRIGVLEGDITSMKNRADRDVQELASERVQRKDLGIFFFLKVNRVESY